MGRWKMAQEVYYTWDELGSYDDPREAVAHYEHIDRPFGQKAIFDDNGEGQPLDPDQVYELAGIEEAI
jgi:hypothetical protein